MRKLINPLVEELTSQLRHLLTLSKPSCWKKFATDCWNDAGNPKWRGLPIVLFKKVWNHAINCEVGRWLRQHIFTKHPNLPKLVGDGIGILGVMFLLLALKSNWYAVPQYLFENAEGVYETTNLTSPWEKRFKLTLMILFPLTVVLFFILRKRVLTRTKIQGNFAAIILLISFAFCQLTVVDEGELSKIAAMHVANHDNLTWYGGDIPTSRGQEIYGNAVDYIAKDLPFIVAPVPLPYQSYDLASFQDFLQWSGMCPAFWNYFRKGWGLLSLSGIFILISAVCVRLEGEQKGLASEVVGYLLKRAAVILLAWYGVIFVRTQLCANALEQARSHYENRQIDDSLAALKTAGKIMPSTHWDSSLVFQRGLLEKELHLRTPGADLYDGFLYERQDRPQAAYQKYIRVIQQSEDRPAQIEAYRSILRLAINHFNTGEWSKCIETLATVEEEFPALMKLLFLRFMMAIKNGDYDEGLEWQRKLYAASGVQQMADRRGYLASTHQYLAQLAFDRGDIDVSWQHNIYRQELNSNGAARMKTPEMEEE